MMCAGGKLRTEQRLSLPAFACGIQLLPLADIGLGLCFLRTDVGIEQLVYALTIDDQIGTVVTAVVILFQPVSIIFDSLECLSHLHTEVGHER